MKTELLIECRSSIGLREDWEDWADLLLAIWTKTDRRTNTVQARVNQQFLSSTNLRYSVTELNPTQIETIPSSFCSKWKYILFKHHFFLTGSYEQREANLEKPKQETQPTKKESGSGLVHKLRIYT